VLVVHDGRIVEDGPPRALLADPHSRYRALVTADAKLREDTWSRARWRRHTMTEGRLAPTEDDR
jgi:ABC-type glutathione transport system ATPase component